MKLALIFLVCFVSISYQQQYLWPYQLGQGLYYFPFYYGSGFFQSPRQNQLQQKDQEVSNKDAYQVPNVIAIPESSFAEQNPKESPVKEETPSLSSEQISDTSLALQQANARNKDVPNGSQRLLFVNPYNVVNSFLSTITKTQTVTVTSTTLVTTAAVTTCIPTAQFVAGSTTPCAVRKRHIVEDILLAEISPSQPEKIEPTESRRADRERRQAAVELSPSKEEEPQDGKLMSFNLRQARANIVFTTTTSTSFVYSFTSTGLLKTVSRGIPLGLICLPSGYVVC